ncbi:MAG: fused MFS/spermidine synthase [Opitutaceae bacterium]|nr:fused MFS/spermidine synthase [Opitutaceae bacterium]
MDARPGESDPYHLYSISNAGGLAAVILYPLSVERAVGLEEQVFLWQGLFWVLAGLVGVAGFFVLGRRGDPTEVPDEITELIPWRRVLAWFAVSALTCVGMLGATHHVAAEIGSSPMAWVGPFGAYLLSFLVVFSGCWQPRSTLLCLGWLALSLTGFVLSKGVSNATVSGPAVFWLLSLVAAGSFYGNGLLYELRPTQRFARFYLVLAAGGVAGGLFAAFGAPILFLRPTEFLLVSCVFLMIGALRLLARRDAVTVAVTVLIVCGPVLGQAWRQGHEEAEGATRLRRFRNIYGCATLRSEEAGLVLSSETTTHGTQIVTNPEARRRPTLYYTESSAVGRVIEETQKLRPTMRIGAVGLGAGTLAAYARSGDVIDFWDIDPKAIRVAREFFTFVGDCLGQLQIEQADGRRGLAAAQADYDLIVIDAFCGDAIPAHLLTREALEIYMRRLEKRQGFLLIHASNRYSTIFPVVAATARGLDLAAVNVVSTVGATTDTRDWDSVGIPVQYIVVCRGSQVETLKGWLPGEEDEGRVKREVAPYYPRPDEVAAEWTDDRHAALEALDVGRYLRGE